MPTHNPLEILLAHDQWATGQILHACEKLTRDQFHQKFDIGPGSLHATTTHIMGAMRTWTDSLACREPGPRPDQDGKQRTPEELHTLLGITARDFGAEANRLPLSETITRSRNGKTYIFTRGMVVTHVTTHGMHHRAQCLNMLRHLGVEPLPASSIAEWARMTEGAGK